MAFDDRPGRLIDDVQTKALRIVRLWRRDELVGMGPGARTFGLHFQPIEQGGRGLVAGASEANDEAFAAAVEEELLHRISEQPARIEPTEDPLIVGPAEAANRNIRGAARRPADERGDGGRDAADGPDAAWDFLDIDAGI